MQEVMNVGDIAFPNLGIYLENVPKSFSVFGFSIAWYGVIMGLAIMAGLAMAVREAKLTNQNPDTYWDFAIYGIVFSILGARIYYVVFAWDMYKDNLWSIFNLRGGGIAIYGAVLGAIITLLVYCKVKKCSPLQMGDTAVLGLVIGQIIGRWGNFMNREAFGEYSEGLFAMRLPLEAVRSSDISTGIAEHLTEGVNYIQVHPTFLYESLWNVMVLILLLLYRKKKKFQGELCLLYLAAYGIGRFWIEGLRTDQLLLPNSTIAVSQVLAILMLLFALAADVLMRKFAKSSK